MKPLSDLIKFAAVGLAALSLVGCASLPRLTGSERVAIVNFSLGKSIVKSGDPADNGPGLLNDKSVDYYQFHKAAIAQAWAAFKTRTAEAFAPLTVVDPATVQGNPAVLAVTAPTKQSFMGMEQSSDAKFVFPEGLNYVNLVDPVVTKGLAAVVPADLLVSIALDARWDMFTGGTIGGFGGGSAYLIVTATVVAVSADGKVVRTAFVTGGSKETAPVASFGPLGSSGVAKTEYPRLLVSALDDLLPKIHKAIAIW